MRKLLIASGVLGALAWIAPGLVILGMFYGILPGIALAVAPSLFVYLAVATGIRRVLPLRSARALDLSSFAVALAIGWLVMQPGRIQQQGRYEAAQIPEVGSGDALELSGEIRLEWPRPLGRRAGPLRCDHICAALLATPGVEGVTWVNEDGASRFELVPAAVATGAGVQPYEPSKILPLFHQVDARRGAVAGGKSRAAREAEADALDSDWALRLAGDERLLASAPLDRTGADWSIVLTREIDRRSLSVYRLEVLAGDGAVRLRRSYVEHFLPARFFYWDFIGGSAGSGFAGRGFRLATQKVFAGDSYLKSSPEHVLVSSVVMARPQVAAERTAELREAVVAALGDPEADKARLEPSRTWLGQFWFDAEEKDHALIARIVEDLRVSDLVEPLQGVFRRDEIPVALRAGFVRRVLDPATTEKERRYYATGLASMPEGTFRHPTAAEQSIWEDAELRRQAAPFLARLADQGDAALPRLVEILEAAGEIEPWNRRSSTITGVREGFLRLGPDAAAAIPVVRELFLRRPSPILHNSGDATDWRFALVRMGLPLEEVPFFPSANEGMIERELEKLRAKIARIDKEDAG